MKRKLLSVLMALCLILTLLPTAVFAEELTPRKNPENSRKSRSRSLRLLKRSQTIREKEQEEKRTFSPSDGDLELPAGDGEDERDPQTPEDGAGPPPGRKSLKNGSTSVPNEVPLQEIILLEESAVTMGTERRDDGI